jgi:predicted nucleic acid-binding protein
MKLVADANILFSLARPDSVASELVSRYRIKLYSPKYVLSELSNHMDEITKKTGQPYNQIIERLKGFIEYSEPEEYETLLVQAGRFLKDEADTPYLALAIKLQVPIWSNDRHLKEQEKIPVFSTKELVELLTSV